MWQICILAQVCYNINMSRRKQNKQLKRNKRGRIQYIKLVVVCVEVLLLVLVAGMGIGFWYKGELEKTEKQMQRVVVIEESIVQLPEEKRDSEALQEESEPESVQEEMYIGRYATELADLEYCEENHIYAKEALAEEEVVLAFAGDISLAEGYANMSALSQREGKIEKCFDEGILAEMQNADVFMVNNEFPYTDRGVPIEGKTYTFRAKPESVSYLNGMGVDIVSVANNHAYDYGEVSLLDTLDVLQKAKMPYVGAGRNIEEAIKPTYFVVNDIKIAYVSATQIEQGDNPDTVGAGENTAGVFRCWNDERICEVIKEAKTKADFVVAYIHWGTELTEVLHWAQLDLAPKLADAGADLIVGDHPHCLQEITYIGNVPVVYSMGNFWFNSKTQDTGILKAVIAQDGIKSLQFVPAIQSGCKTRMAMGAEGERILNYIRTLSPSVVIDGSGYITKR